MGTLHRIGRVAIRIYANNYLPPHFHIVDNEFEAIIEIATMKPIEGHLRKSGKRVLDWAVVHRGAILAEWNRVNPRYPVVK